MIDYLYQTSDLNLFLTLGSFFVSISVLALFLIKKFWPLHLRYQENAVVGCTSSLVIVIYGVLSGFATLYLINNNNLINDALQNEANSAANIYWDSQTLSEPLRTQLKTEIQNYLTEVLNVEWPLMNKGKTIPNDGDFIIQHILTDIKNYKITTPTESLLLTNIIVVSSQLYDARQHRIQMSYMSLSNEIWVVVLIGTILTLWVSYLFGVHFYLHIFIAIVAALMTSSIIFLLISLDKPFQGDFVLGPHMYQSVATLISKN